MGSGAAKSGGALPGGPEKGTGGCMGGGGRCPKPAHLRAFCGVLAACSAPRFWQSGMLISRLLRPVIAPNMHYTLFVETRNPRTCVLFGYCI